MGFSPRSEPGHLPSADRTGRDRERRVLYKWTAQGRWSWHMPNPQAKCLQLLDAQETDPFLTFPDLNSKVRIINVFPHPAGENPIPQKETNPIPGFGFRSSVRTVGI